MKFKIIKNTWDLVRETYNRTGEIDIALHSAAIAFYAIFSTAPLLIILLWLVGLIWGSSSGQAELQETVELMTGEDVANTIQSIVKASSRNGTGLISSIMAIVTLLFGATTLLAQIKQSLNSIWGIQDPKISSIWQFLWARLVSLLFIGLLSLLFILGLASESILYGMSDLLLPVLGSQQLLFFQYLSSTLNIVLAFSFLAVLFKVMPDVNVRWRDIAVGAAVTTLLVLVGKTLIDWYLMSSDLQQAYQAAGSFVIFLIWVYYNVFVILIGAIFTQVFTSRFGGEIHAYWNATLIHDWYEQLEEES